MQQEDVKTVAITGMGTMGRGIAQCFASNGFNMRCHDPDPEALARALPLIDSIQETLVNAGLLSCEDALFALDSIECFSDFEECVLDAQVVIEAAPERLDLKMEIIERLDRLCAPPVVLATNTSGLSISRIASAAKHPERVAGFHWWNPAHLMPLVEVTRGEKTSDETAQLLLWLARRLGKRPILVRRDVPGFVGNRLQFAVLREALHLVQEGIASPEDVDTAMKAGPGLRYAFLGPLETADLGGLDVFASISEYLFAELSAAKRPPACLTEAVRQNRLGVKSGAGFYDYSGKRLEELLAARDSRLIDVIAALGNDDKKKGTRPCK